MGNAKIELKNFFDSDHNVELDWVSGKAEQLANSLAYENKQDKRSEKALSGTQLRNFFNEFQRIKTIPNISEKERFALIKMIVAKIKYKKTAHPKDFKQDFVDFISNLINEVGMEEKRFDGACMIMEAIVGFYPKNR